MIANDSSKIKSLQGLRIAQMGFLVCHIQTQNFTYA